jgi:hypothetical protein
VFKKLGNRLARRVIASARTFVADKPAVRAGLRALWRTARTRGWVGYGGALNTARKVLDAALPLSDQVANWALVADKSAMLSAVDLAAALAECQGGSGIIVAVSHDDFFTVFGGVQNVISDEQRVFEAAGWRYLHLAPAAPLPVLGPQGHADAYHLGLRLSGKGLGVATFAMLADALAAVHASGTRLQFVFHHLKGHVPEFLATLPAMTGTRPMVWVHDFFTLCPSFNLMRNDVKFCGAPPLGSSACEICVFGADRQAHMPRMRAFFEATHPIVLFPSEVARTLWLRQGRYAHADARVVPLARLVMAKQNDPIVKSAASPLRVAHLGSSIRQKGWNVFEALAIKHAKDRRYKFYHLGIDGIPSLKYSYVPVRVTPDQRNAMVDAVMRHRIDVVIAWSVWPETFCFTAHEALAGGAFVIARRAAGNIWPAVEANAPAQGCAVAEEAELFRLFESGEILPRVARATRLQGTLYPGGNTAGLLLEDRTTTAALNDLEAVGP